MKINIIFIIILMLHYTLKAQVNNEPKKIGLQKELTGTIESFYEYDGDRFITLKDNKIGLIDIYFWAGSCHGLGDPFAIDSDIKEELWNRIYTERNFKNLKVTISAKSTYAWLCGNCDECDGPEKIMVWRPLRITQVSGTNAETNNITQRQANIINTLITAAKANDRITIADMFYYPIVRKYPLNPIQNREEFLESFDYILDPILLRK